MFMDFVGHSYPRITPPPFPQHVSISNLHNHYTIILFYQLPTKFRLQESVKFWLATNIYLHELK
jgi:hypothetical protein